MNDRDMLIRCAKVFIAQSRASKFRGWSFTLLEWAARARRRAQELSAPQGELFTTEKGIR